MKNLIIAGYSGSGKSVIGRNAAEQLGFDFVETSEKIHSITGMPPEQLLKKHGAIRYRSEEKLIFQKLAAKSNQVIALDSLLCETERLILLKPEAFFVLLRVEPNLIYRRLQKRRSKRLTFDELTADIARFESICLPLCDFVIKTGDCSIESAAAYILQEYQKQCL
ncbi:MAG: AAA family ATPase [Firmicutes bacterium]|nr:AAA family ATPase [Bacillota bacterium]